MVTAVEPVEALRTPLLDELEDILGTFASLMKPAQKAVVETLTSLVADPELTVGERDLAIALLVLATASH